MVRRAPGPASPRVSEPDLPDTLTRESSLGRRAELFGARIVGLAGDVDAAYSHLVETAVEAASVDRLDLTGATLTDVRVTDLRAVEMLGRDSRWRTAEVIGGRIGTVDLARAELDGVLLSGLRLDYLSLASATVTDVRFVGCDIRTIDLPEATLTRARFEDCRADEVDTRGLRATDLDLRGLEALSYTDPRALRGATLSLRQVEALAGSFAAALGIDVRD